MGESERERWLEAGWTRVVTVVVALLVVWSGEILLAIIGSGPATKVDVVAAISAVVVSLAMLAAVSGRRLSRVQWVRVGFVYMLVLVVIAAVGRYEAAPVVGRGWAAVTILIVVFPVMFPASPQAAAAFGAASLVVDVGVAHAFGQLPDEVTLVLGRYHGFLMGTLLSVALSYIVQRLGHKELEARSLGSYTLVEKLGEGGMGEVWRANHALLKRGAAVKLISPERVRDERSREAYRQRFEREVQSASRLRSPYTVEIFDFGQREDGVLWFAMELLDGLDLVELTFQNRPLPIERVIFILQHVCHSLEEAHEHGLVHRDIKPNNVIVGRMGAEYDFVKVLDFGLVKTEGSTEEEAKLTRQGATPGTPGFMSPEQILTPKKVDARADVYGVGCLAYFMITGRLVFEADDWERVKTMHVKEPVVPPSRRTEFDVPGEMDGVILKCLEKDPKRRYQTIAEVAEALGEIPTEENWTRARARQAWEGYEFRGGDWTLAD